MVLGAALFWTSGANERSQLLPEITGAKYVVAGSYFLLARILEIYGNVVMGNDSSYYTNKAYIEERWEQCTSYEKNYFEFVTNFWEGDSEASFEALIWKYLKTRFTTQCLGIISMRL